MPPRLSKFFIDISCREYAHPWTDSCISTTAGLGLHSLQESLRIYTTVYIVTLLMKGKIPSKDDLKRTVLGILQSTAFLSWSAFSYSIFICFLRRLLGHFNILTVSFLPSFLSSLSAILIERPSRRTLLCLYVSNIATETLFRMGVWREYFSVIPHGETYIFATSVAILLYLFRSKSSKDSIYKIIRFAVGPYEQIDYFKNEDVCSDSSSCSADTKVDERSKEHSDKKRHQMHNFNVLWKSFQTYQQIIEYLKNQSKHMSCPHPHSCIHYALSGGARLFSYGICAQMALKLIFQAKRIFKNPKLLRPTLLRKENLNLALFVGGFAGLYRAISCSLRRFYGKDSPSYAIPAGLIAGVAFLAYPDNTIALYFMWKTLQMIWNDAVETRKVPEIKWFVILLYCFSTAVLFHAAIVEPHNLRTSYWKFLHTISGGRIATMSRAPLDEFGLETSKSLQEVLRRTHTTDQNKYSF